MQKKKKTNVFLFTVIMAIVFIVINEIVVYGYAGSFLQKTIVAYPQGNLVIGEAVLASLVLIVMLLFKNSYVFTQKKKKIGVGLFYGLFYILYSILWIVLNLGALKSVDIHAILNLAIGCLLIGITEEFLCRGWLLNEFLERFNKTKSGIWYSIVVSGIIFGLMHIPNMFAGQSASETLIQTFNAAAVGIVLGLIYYKTKNIWSVILLHGLWDFSLMTSEILPVYEKQLTTTQTSVISLTFTILMTLAELIVIVPHIKNLDTKPKKGTIIGMSFVAFVLYGLFMGLQVVMGTSMGEVYKYENINLKNYATINDNYEDYYIKYNQYSFKLSKAKKNTLVISNLNTNYFVEFECGELQDYILYKEKDNYILAYVDLVDGSNVFIIYKYIPISSLSNDNDFLNSIKTGMKKYLLPNTIMKLQIIKDETNDVSYLSAFNVDVGNYLLINENQISILNRDN